MKPCTSPYVRTYENRYLITAPKRVADEDAVVVDDDAAEGRTADDPRDRSQGDRGQGYNKFNKQGKRDKRGDKKKGKGTNTERDFGRSADAIRLCVSRAHTPEFSPRECSFGSRCNLEHDLRKYLAEGRRSDLEVYEGKCPVWEKLGRCPNGWRCLFLRSHMKEIEHEDGRKELILIEDPDRKQPGDLGGDNMPGVVNIVTMEQKLQLGKKKVDFSVSEKYIAWTDKDQDMTRKLFNQKRTDSSHATSRDAAVEDYRANFVDPPFKASEKRRLYFGRETPVLAPLTTQGNLPFRRLCVELGAGSTYSEMAVGFELLQGKKSEWALLKAHESELAPPKFESPEAAASGYDNSRDSKFGAQIAANVPWVAIKTTQAMTEYLPHLRLIDLNCGCPINMVFDQGAGSALLDAPAKVERMVRGMNAVSGEVPITTKLRLGVRDGKPTALKNIERLAFGAHEVRDRLGAPGCAAITLHGRTRQQRYRSEADWGYIAQCASMIKSYQEKKDDLTDTIHSPEENTLANGGKMHFIGNGDCFSHIDYFNHLDNAKVDTVMIARGALIKPWIFEEIEKGQYLDKSATERLAYVEKFARYGIEAWGSDEIGIGFARKFLLEYLSFTHRYIPIGILEHLPPKINDRPPAYRGRDDLETLLASDNYKDWIKIR